MNDSKQDIINKKLPKYYESWDKTQIETGVNYTTKLENENTTLFCKIPTFNSGNNLKSEVIIQSDLYFNNYPTPMPVESDFKTYFITEYITEKTLSSQEQYTDTVLRKIGGLSANLITNYDFEKCGEIRTDNNTIIVDTRYNRDIDYIQSLIYKTKSQCRYRTFAEYIISKINKIEQQNIFEELLDSKKSLVNMDFSPRNILNSNTYYVIDWGDCKILPWQFQQVITEFNTTNLLTDETIQKQYKKQIRTGFEKEFGQSITEDMNIYNYILLYLYLRKLRGMHIWFNNDKERIEKEIDIMKTRIKNKNI